MNIPSKVFISAVVVGLVVVCFAIHTALHYLGTGAVGTTYRIAQGQTDTGKFFRAECSTWQELGFIFSKSFPISDYYAGGNDAAEQYLLAREHLYTLVELRCSKRKEATITQLP